MSVQQLPSGRHGLPRDYVVANQRERMLDAVREIATESGYAEVTVSAVIDIAGVSRKTFYEQFADVADAIAAAFDGDVTLRVGVARLDADGWAVTRRAA